MENIIIKVNEKEIPLSDFPAEFIVNSICGMLKSLKGIDEIKKVEIQFEL